MLIGRSSAQPPGEGAHQRAGEATDPADPSWAWTSWLTPWPSTSL